MHYTLTRFLLHRFMGVCLLLAAMPAIAQELTGWGSNTSGALSIPADLKKINILAAGQGHISALKSNGTVVAWGSNSAGQTNVPLDLTEVKSIVAGSGHTLALKSDGTVAAWGDNTHGQSTVPAGLTGVIAVAASGEHSVALKSDGTVVAWGRNSEGQTSVPAGLTHVKAIAAGGFHSVALKVDGTLAIWGDNSFGQSSVPAGLPLIKTVAAGPRQTLVIKHDGTVAAWGDNTHGQLTVPAGLTGVKAIAAGPDHVLALKADGTVVAWGNNTSGQVTTPANLAGVTAIAAGAGFSVALKADTRKVFSWGFLYSQKETPADLVEVTAVVVGLYQKVALKANGTVVAWGGNTSGEATVPTDLTNVTAVAAGFNQSFALKADGTVSGWGMDYRYQVTGPMSVNQVIAVASGSYHSLVLKADGTVTVWGDHSDAQTAVPSELTGVKAIAAGDAHSIALKADGTVVAWGANHKGQSNVPTGLTNVIAITAKGDCSIALKADGTMVGWGDTQFNQLSFPGGLTGIKQVSLGQSHTVALKSDGTVAAWGKNTDGEATVPAGLENVTEVSAGGYHTAVVAYNQRPRLTKTNGSVWYHEEGAPVILNPTFAIIDDDQEVNGATIWISKGFVAGDVLTTTDVPGVNFYYDALTGMMTISGKATKADYTNLLNNLTFYSLSESPGLQLSRTVSYVVSDSYAASDPEEVVLSIVPINDAPAFTVSNVTLLAGTSPQTFPNQVTAISPGPADENAQTLTFMVGSNKPALFSSQPAISPTGTLSFTLAPNASGTATVTVVLKDDGGTAGSGVDHSQPQTFTITIIPVNDAPSFAKGTDVVLLDDFSPQTYPNWATAISPGPADENTQTLTFLVTGDNSALFSSQPTISPTGTLTFTPVANASGTATVTVVLKDNGGTANGGADQSQPQTFTITVTPVNDAPRFTRGADVVVWEDAGSQRFANWATAIASGATNEAGQTLDFLVTSDHHALFSELPALDAAGTLTFTPAANAYGTATVTVVLKDDGGTANGAVDQSQPQTFTITVTPVNDAPYANTPSDITLPGNSGPQTITLTGIAPGPAEAGQTLSITAAADNPGLVGNPVMVYAPGSTTASLNFTPAPGQSGIILVTVQVHDDGGTAGGGVDEYILTFRITIAALPEPEALALFIPTLFSPNGDNTNDVFRVRGTGVETIQLRVFNQMGLEVFWTRDRKAAMERGWDGTYRGREMPAGVYTWTISGRYTHGGPLSVGGKTFGQVTLVR